jgi:hypothetical protein
MQLATLEEYKQLALPVLLLVGEGRTVCNLDIQPTCCHNYLGSEDDVTPVADTYAIFDQLPQAHGPHVPGGAKHNLMEATAELLNALVATFLIKKGGMKYLKYAGDRNDRV